MVSAKKPFAAKQQSRPVPEAESVQAELIWGLNPVAEALHQPERSLHELRVVQGKASLRVQELIDLARAQGLPVRFVPEFRLGVPPGVRHQGLVARLAAVPSLPLEALLAEGKPPLVVLDCIQDPHNLGAIMRSALAAGFSRIILPKDRSAPLGGTVAKSSAGAVSHLQVCRVANVAETLRSLKERGYWVFGAVADPAAVSLYATEFPEASCLVIGGEGKGIRPLVQKRCDQLFTIPMSGSFNSLNASAAAAVIFFEYARRRLAP